jgi:hypothetical protein
MLAKWPTITLFFLIILSTECLAFTPTDVRDDQREKRRQVCEWIVKNTLKFQFADYVCDHKLVEKDFGNGFHLHTRAWARYGGKGTGGADSGARIYFEYHFGGMKHEGYSCNPAYRQKDTARYYSERCEGSGRVQSKANEKYSLWYFQKGDKGTWMQRGN